MRYYLAGGAVRDILLGKAPHEYDIVFDGTPDEFRRLRESATVVGKTTQNYIVAGRDHTPLAGTIAQDLENRDLTINALLMDEDGVIHALPSTFADLKNGILRHASPRSFDKDPVRVFRAARFAAVMPGFSIAPDTLALMRQCASGEPFHAVAAERVGNELVKAMHGPVPGNFLEALRQADALAPWLSPFENAHTTPAGPPRYHGDDSVLDHACAVMNVVACMEFQSETDRSLAVWMALCHDVGKLFTDSAQWPRHIGHDKTGAEHALALAKRLKLPVLWRKAATTAAALHMKGGRYAQLRPGSKVDILHTLHALHLFIPFCALVAADSAQPELGAAMRRDMEAMLAVKLPEKWRNQGATSAVRLRELRAKALAGQKTNP